MSPSWRAPLEPFGAARTYFAVCDAHDKENVPLVVIGEPETDNPVVVGSNVILVTAVDHVESSLKNLVIPELDPGSGTKPAEWFVPDATKIGISLILIVPQLGAAETLPVPV